MDFHAIRKVACRKPGAKKPEPKATGAPKPPPAPGPPAAPTPAPHPGPPQGSAIQPHTGHYMEVYDHVPPDPRFGYMEHSRSWKLGFNHNYTDNCSCQDYHQAHNPGPQEYYRSYYGHPGMNYKQIGYHPDDYMGSYMDGHHGHHHHGYGQLSRGYCPRSPPAREFGPGACCPPPLMGPPPLDYHYHGGPPPLDYNYHGGTPRGVSQYYLPSPHDNYFSAENPNGCSIM